VDAFWVSYQRKLDHSLTIDVTVGVAWLDNVNETEGNSDTDYLVKLKVKKTLK